MGSFIRILFAFVFISALSFYLGGFLVSFRQLSSSIKEAKHYKETDCTVESSYVSSICDDNACTTYNNDIWWYNTYGTTYYFSSNGKPSNGEYSGNDDDDHNHSEEDDDGGDDDDDDDGGDDDDDDDGGGDDDGGDDGGDDDVLKQYSVQLTSGGSYPQHSIKKIIKKSLLSKLRNLTNTTNSSSACSSDYNSCYQGIQNISFIDENGIKRNSSISGLWSDDVSWVTDYTTKYSIGSIYTCYYSDSNYLNAMWFKPPKYSKDALALVIILFLLGTIALIGSLYILIKHSHHFNCCCRYIRKHHHHHGSHHDERSPLNH